MKKGQKRLKWFIKVTQVLLKSHRSHWKDSSQFCMRLMAQGIFYVIHFYPHHLATVSFHSLFNRKGSDSFLKCCNMLSPVHSTSYLNKNHLCSCTPPAEIWDDCTRLETSVVAAGEQIGNISIAFLASEGFSCKDRKNSFGKISLLIRGVINQSGDTGLDGIIKCHMIAGVSSTECLLYFLQGLDSSYPIS